MKKTGTTLGLALLGTMLISFAGTPQCKAECENLQIDDIVYIEMEDEINLGFDTAQYLPEGFDPYKGMGLDIKEITFIEPIEEVNLGFNTALYLPEDFNAYEGMAFDLNDIEYIEEEEEIILGFDTKDYLPENFSTL